MSAVHERSAEKRHLEEDQENGVEPKEAKHENGNSAVREVAGDVTSAKLKEKKVVEEINDEAEGEEADEGNEESSGDEVESVGDEEEGGSEDEEGSIGSEEGSSEGEGGEIEGDDVEGDGDEEEE